MRRRGRRRAGLQAAVVLLGLLGWTGLAFAQPLLGSGDMADAVAVVIGNKDYRRAVPVEYADNDAKAMHDFLVNSLGFRDQNVIQIQNATFNDFVRQFGTERSAQIGEVWRRVVSGRSDVFVYYSGHGVPDLTTRQSFLLPADGDPNVSDTGYALETLYRNLEQVKQKVGSARQVIVMIDACFTGETGRKDKPLLAISAPGFVPARPRTGGGIIKLVATSGTAPANWDDQTHLGLFTSRFLMGAAGLAVEESSSGQGVPWGRLRTYLRSEVEMAARRTSGREQVPEVDEASLSLPLRSPVPAVSVAVETVRDEGRWQQARGKASLEGYQDYIGQCGEVCAHREEASRAWSALRGQQRGQEQRREDMARWQRLSAAGQCQEYLDGCGSGTSCLYKSLAETCALGAQDTRTFSRQPSPKQLPETDPPPAPVANIDSTPTPPPLQNNSSTRNLPTIEIPSDKRRNSNNNHINHKKITTYATDAPNIKKRNNGKKCFKMDGELFCE